MLPARMKRRRQEDERVGQEPHQAARDDDRVERGEEGRGGEGADAEGERDRHAERGAQHEDDQERLGHSSRRRARSSRAIGRRMSTAPTGTARTRSRGERQAGLVWSSRWARGSGSTGSSTGRAAWRAPSSRCPGGRARPDPVGRGSRRARCARRAPWRPPRRSSRARRRGSGAPRPAPPRRCGRRSEDDLEEDGPGHRGEDRPAEETEAVVEALHAGPARRRGGTPGLDLTSGSGCGRRSCGRPGPPAWRRTRRRRPWSPRGRASGPAS